jgi:energy-coupling factor transporter transmembrane protein EcfT
MSTMTKSGPTGVAGWLLVVFAVLVLANTAVSASRSGATGADWSFAVLLVVVAGAAARSLWLGVRWAWWTSFALAFVGLFFVLPVTGTILLGTSMEPVGTGWDVVFFPLTTAVLVALLVALWLRRKPAARASN